MVSCDIGTSYGVLLRSGLLKSLVIGSHDHAFFALQNYGFATCLVCRLVNVQVRTDEGGLVGPGKLALSLLGVS